MSRQGEDRGCGRGLRCGEGWTHWREVYRCFLMPLSVPCFRKDKIEKSDGQTLLYQAKFEATKASNHQI